MLLLRPHVKKVSVFGSFARGEDTPESDIDLLVQLKPREMRPHLGFKWFGLWDEARRNSRQEEDLVSESALSPYVRKHGKRNGAIV